MTAQPSPYKSYFFAFLMIAFPIAVFIFGWEEISFNPMEILVWFVLIFVFFLQIWAPTRLSMEFFATAPKFITLGGATGRLMDYYNNIDGDLVVEVMFPTQEIPSGILRGVEGAIAFILGCALWIRTDSPQMFYRIQEADCIEGALLYKGKIRGEPGVDYLNLLNEETEQRLELAIERLTWKDKELTLFRSEIMDLVTQKEFSRMSTLELEEYFASKFNKIIYAGGGMGMGMGMGGTGIKELGEK